MQPEKKQLEILLMDYFRKGYPDFPKGSVAPSESPDFLLKMKSKNMLGIELTRLNPGNASEPNARQREEVHFRNNLIQFSLELFERHSNIKLFVKFLFSEDKKVTAEREMTVAVLLSNSIKKAIRNKNGNRFFKETIHKKELPEGMEEVLIVHHPKLKTSIWERSNNLGVSNDVVDDIRNAIHKKDEKLRLYQQQHLNYYWLLITTDRLRGLRSFNLPEKVINHKFHSRFQHVFLFDLIKSRVYTLV